MKDTVIQFTKKLIAIPSTFDNVTAQNEIINIVKEELTMFPLQEFIRNNSRSILVSNQPHIKNFTIILNAHLDVVPGTKEQFIPFEKDGRLYGRGAYDMKAAATTMIFLFKELANKVQYPLALQFVTDEEHKGYDGTGYQVERGVRGKFVIVGETGSNFHIKNRSKGHIALKLTTIGKASHGAYPWLGENAIMHMHGAIDAIKKAYPTPTDALWEPTVTVSRIETTNQIHNKVPDNCTAYLDVRYTPEQKDTIIRDIKSILHKKVLVEVLWFVEPHYTEPHNKYLMQLDNAYEQITGKAASLIASHGGSDMRFYTAVGNAAVEFGLIGDGHHANNEWVYINSIDTYYQVLKKFLLLVNSSMV